MKVASPFSPKARNPVWRKLRASWGRFGRPVGKTTLLLSPLLVAIMTLVILASPVAEAPFRLNVVTEVIWLVVGSADAELGFDTSEWQLHQPVVTEFSAGPDESTVIRNGTAQPGFRYRLLVHPKAGDQVDVSSSSVGAPTPRMSLRFPERPVVLTVTGFDAATPFPISSVARDGRDLAGHTSLVNASVGGRSASRIEFTPFPTSSARSTRIQIARLGFGLDEGMLRSGLLAGQLYFLDMPATDDIKIFRGSDLRLEGKDLVVESLSVTQAGLEMSVSGLATAASIRVGASGTAHGSMLPTYFDKVQRKPLLVGGIGAVTLLIGVYGLLLAAAPLYRRIALGIGAKPPV